MTTSTQQITVNGTPREVPASLRLDDLLREQGIDPDDARGVAVAVNDRVVRRGTWEEVRLGGGDRVEIVTARQGGCVTKDEMTSLE